MVTERTYLSNFRDVSLYAADTGEETDQLETFRLGAELLLFQFIRDVWVMLAERHEGKNCKADVYRQWLLDRLDVMEVDEYHCLTPAMVSKVAQAPLRFVSCRPQSGAAYRNNGINHFAQYNTGNWYDKLKGLFGSEDTPDGVRKKRRWDSFKFRILMRQLTEIVEQTWDNSATTDFMETLYLEAVHTLWIIPQYQVDNFSAMYKVPKSGKTGKHLEGMTPLAGTNWIVPQLPSALHAKLKKVESAVQRHTSDQELTGWQQRDYKLIRQELQNTTGLSVLEHEMMRYGTQTQGVIRDPTIFGMRLDMELALDHRKEATADV